MVLNALVGSTGVLVASVIEVLMDTETRVVIESLSKGFETLYLTSKGGGHLFGVASPAVGEGKRAASGIYMLFFLELMSA